MCLKVSWFVYRAKFWYKVCVNKLYLYTIILERHQYTSNRINKEKFLTAKISIFYSYRFFFSVLFSLFLFCVKYWLKHLYFVLKRLLIFYFKSMCKKLMCKKLMFVFIWKEFFNNSDSCFNLILIQSNFPWRLNVINCKYIHYACLIQVC